MKAELETPVLQAYDRVMRILQYSRNSLSSNTVKDLESTIDAIETSIAIKCLEQYRSLKNEQ